MTPPVRTAMVLSAGYGQRLRPLTSNKPKPLLPVAGEPIIHKVLRLLKKEGFERAVINLHYLGEMIRESVGDGSSFGLDVIFSEEPELLGTGGGIKAAQRHLGDDTFLVINADVLTDAALSDIWRFHKNAGGVATLVTRDSPGADGHGAIMIDHEGRVRQVLGRPKVSVSLKPRLFTGIQVVEPVFFDFVRPGEKTSSTGDVYPAMLKAGLEIYKYDHRGLFVDIGTPEEYRKVNLPDSF